MAASNSPSICGTKVPWWDQGPWVDLIRKHVRSGGLDPKKYEHERGSVIAWNFRVGSMSAILSLRDSDGIVLFNLEVALGHIPPESVEAICGEMLSQNRQLMELFKLAAQEGVAYAIARGSECMTAEYFAAVLENFFSFASSVQASLISRGLRPFFDPVAHKADISSCRNSPRHVKGEGMSRVTQRKA